MDSTYVNQILNTIHSNQTNESLYVGIVNNIKLLNRHENFENTMLFMQSLYYLLKKSNTSDDILKTINNMKLPNNNSIKPKEIVEEKDRKMNEYEELLKEKDRKMNEHEGLFKEKDKQILELKSQLHSSQEQTQTLSKHVLEYFQIIRNLKDRNKRAYAIITQLRERKNHLKEKFKRHEERYLNTRNLLEEVFGYFEKQYKASQNTQLSKGEQIETKQLNNIEIDEVQAKENKFLNDKILAECDEYKKKLKEKYNRRVGEEKEKLQTQLLAYKKKLDDELRDKIKKTDFLAQKARSLPQDLSSPQHSLDTHEHRTKTTVSSTTK